MYVHEVVVFTDGANMPHHEFKHAGAAAIAQLTTDGGLLVYEWGRYLGDQTNNIAELSAIELAVVLARTYAPSAPLIVVTDSQYCQGVLSFDMARERWKYRAKKNKELVGRIRKILPALGLFEIRWVKGHSGNRLNERADQVAKFCKESREDWTASYWENAGFPPLVGKSVDSPVAGMV